ncbi:MAG TPA: hypothetical protein VKB46_03455 [Pyrinomonadaceae bacterium]|nr:hypothetical protein [Pyrinomonadaceae bacterium]
MAVQELAIKLSAEQTAQIRQVTGQVVTELTIFVGNGSNSELPPGPNAKDYPPGPSVKAYPPGPTVIEFPQGSSAAFPPGPTRK